jgi:hypothetical protein
VQTLGLPQDRPRMLQQAAAGRRDARPSAREQRDAERNLHVADAGRGGGEGKVRALGAVGDAAGLDHVAKQAEIGQVEAHRTAFLRIRRIQALPNVNCARRFQSHNFVYGEAQTRQRTGNTSGDIAAGARIG